MFRKTILCALIATCFASGVECLSASQRSIVGRWAEVPSACRSPGSGATVIGPLSLTSDEISCSFTSVSRNGPTVVWRGGCDEGSGARPMRVTATETSNRLIISFKPGGTWSPLQRCGATR